MIHRGTDFAVFSPGAVAPERIEALRKAWDVAPHERVVLLAARLTGWKGQKVLIEAAAKLRDAGLADVAYILAGDPQGRDSYVKDLDGLIEARKLKGIVRRVGHCTDMPAAFLAASVVTVPSTEPEAFGRSAVEAQAMGTPGRRLRSRRGAGDGAGPAGRAAARADGLAHPGRRRRCAGRGARRSPRLGASAQNRPGRPGHGRMWSGTSRSNAWLSSTLEVYSALLEGRLPTQNKLTSRAFCAKCRIHSWHRLSLPSREPLGLADPRPSP